MEYFIGTESALINSILLNCQSVIGFLMHHENYKANCVTNNECVKSIEIVEVAGISKWKPKWERRYGQPKSSHGESNKKRKYYRQ